MVELARHHPDIEIRCLWRPWDDAHQVAKALSDLAPPENFRVVRGKVPRMDLEFHQAHASFLAFVPGFGKSTPNSVLEGFACGRPALLGVQSGIHEVAIQAGAAEAAQEHTHEAMGDALQRLRNNYHERCCVARNLAEENFSLAASQQRYREVYQDLKRLGN